MGRFFLLLFFLSFFFAAGFAVRKWAPCLIANRELSSVEKAFLPAPFPISNRPIAVVLIGRNNGAWVERTLASIFSQNYNNYRLLYIDDASDDGSFDLVRDKVPEHSARITLVRNEERLGFLANLVRAVHSCSDEEIVAVLKEGDWLAHEWVLQRLNQYYADSDLWLTYGQYAEYPNFQRGISRSYKEGEDLRASPFLAQPLQTFYAALFKKLRESDLLHEGSFFPAAAELAYMIPMLEMARGHSAYLSEVLYISSRKEKAREERDLQVQCERAIREKPPYSPIHALSIKEAA